MAEPFAIDGVYHPYNFSEENLKGRFGRIFNHVLYAFHPLLNPLDTGLSKVSGSATSSGDGIPMPRSSRSG